jgi:hypothetical protein
MNASSFYEKNATDKLKTEVSFYELASSLKESEASSVDLLNQVLLRE